MIYCDTAIILAGGKSSRMGFDKQFIRIGNRWLIDILADTLKSIFHEIIIVTNKPGAYKRQDCKIVKDEVTGFGPLSGIHAGLKHSNSIYNYIIACDMPYLNLKYIQYMQELIENASQPIDAIITRFDEWIEPFNSFYNKGLIYKIENHLKQNKKRIFTLLQDAKVIYVPEEKARIYSPQWEMFMNINTLEDLKKYIYKE